MSSENPYKMTSATATNSFDGVLILGLEETMLLSVGNAEKLRNEINECLATAAGYQLREVTADEVEDKSKIVIGLNDFFVKSTLTDRHNRVVIQWADQYGEECELVVPEDFTVSVMDVIE